MKRPNILIVILWSTVVGIAIGAFSWVFMSAYEHVIHLIWKTGFSAAGSVRWYPLVICVVGGVIAGLMHKYFAPVPEPLNEAIAVIAKTKRLEYTHIKEATLAAFNSLIFGGSVGPEAGLTAIIGGACTWLGDKNKALFKKLHAGEKITAKAIKDVAVRDTHDNTLPDGHNTKKSENNPAYLSDYFSRRKLLIIPAVIAGLGAFFLLDKTPWHTEPWLFNHFPDADLPGLYEIASTLVLVLVGFVLGYFDLLLEKIFAFKTLTRPVEKFPLIASIIGGAAMGGLAMLSPFVLFSGETQMETILKTTTLVGAWFFFGTAFLKVFVTRFILATGWKGGQIFPIIFASFSLGLGCAVLSARLGYPLETSWCVGVVCTSAASIALGQPIIIVPLILPLFPWQAWPGILISAAIVLVYLRILRKRNAKRGANPSRGVPEIRAEAKTAEE